MERPHTPTQHWLTSPSQTPQGSPSKKQIPPGATSLASLFDSALKLTPIAALSPTKAARSQQSSPVLMPKDGGSSYFEDNSIFKENTFIHQELSSAPASPKKSTKENAPPSGRLPKESAYQPSAAATSRQELYQQRDLGGAVGRKGYDPQRGLSMEDLEKLQKPQVKRLANVTQLCTMFGPFLLTHGTAFGGRGFLTLWR
jgi:hypothetical protein